MKISPTAIRQKFFETSFRGFEKKQVTDFLEEVSEIMQEINQENLELRSKLQLVEGEAKRLKDVEDSLFRTLKTAEDTGASIITEATEAADQIIAEANQISETTTSLAYQSAEQIKRQAEEHAKIITSAAEAKAKETFKEIRESLQGLIKSYDGLVEQRGALIKSLKRTSQDTLDQIELSEAHFARIDSKAYQKAIEELSRSPQFTAANISALEIMVPPVKKESKSQVEADVTLATPDEETQESIDALQQDLRETPKEIRENEEKNQVEIIKSPEFEVLGENLNEVQETPRVQIIQTSEEPSPKDPQKSPGSFFDEFN